MHEASSRGCIALVPVDLGKDLERHVIGSDDADNLLGPQLLRMVDQDALAVDARRPNSGRTFDDAIRGRPAEGTRAGLLDGDVIPLADAPADHPVSCRWASWLNVSRTVYRHRS